ncbi:MAG: hypothetical protein N2319_00210 [Candidatus Kapabacteria bacterium]|nr:hypothetical protein [Candidatus Kapabacteria bacterium]
MIDKKFDCVEFQRKIRDKFVEEANSNLKELILLLEKKKQISEIYLRLKERKERQLKASE